MTTELREHTKTPWIVQHPVHGNWGIYAPASGKPVCFFHPDDTDQQANAEYICQAVNNHEHLLAACKVVLKIIHDMPLISAKNAVIHAIKQAEGKV